MLDRDTTANSPDTNGSLESGFWNSPTLEELAKAQGVTPLADARILFGTWPGEPDDGFEALIDEMRNPNASFRQHRNTSDGLGSLPANRSLNAPVSP